MSRFKQMLIREGRGCREKGERVKRNNSAALGRVLIPPPGIHRTIFLICFTDMETPTSWEKLIECCPQALDPSLAGIRTDDADAHTPHHQPVKRMSKS